MFEVEVNVVVPCWENLFLSLQQMLKFKMTSVSGQAHIVMATWWQQWPNFTDHQQQSEREVT